MKLQILTFSFLFFFTFSFGQDAYQALTMTTDYSSDNQELRDLLNFEGIDYLKVKFSGEALKTKSFHLTAKEFWDGELVADSTVINSANLWIDQYKYVNDSSFSFRVISKLTDENKLRMQFKFPQFSVSKEFNAIESDEYSLRNIAYESKLDIGYDKKFYLLAYILPYEREDGSKSWCEVGVNGKDIENWGKKFGIKHYLLFEMEFED